MQRSNRRLWKRLVTPFLCAAIAVGAALPTSAAAAFGIAAFDGQVSAADGGPYTQAAGHPFAGSTTIAFNSHLDPEYGLFTIPDGDPRDIYTDLPPGLVGNPTVATKCSLADFNSGGGLTTCQPSAQVGVATVSSTWAPQTMVPVYSLIPRPGVPASFGFMFINVPVMLDARLRSTASGRAASSVSARRRNSSAWSSLMAVSLTMQR